MINRTERNGQPELELATDSLRLAVPLSFGPRVMHFGKKGGANLLLELENEKGAGPGGNYYFRGGHRLWHAPEHPERSYQPDNDPPELELLPDDRGFILRQQTEPATGMRKTVRIETAGPRAVKVELEIANEGFWPVTCAVWGLTMFRPGGRGVIPLLPKGEHPRDLLPDYTLVPWPYTDFSSGGWSFSSSFIGLNTNQVTGSQKLGISGYPGWLGYWLDGDAFIKAAPFDAAASYPDAGSKAEVFSNGQMIELETLGPLVSLAPGASSRHHEFWGVIPGLFEPADEAAVREHWLPAIEQWREGIPSGTEVTR